MTIHLTPERSAVTTLCGWQRVTALCAGAGLLILAARDPLAAGIACIAVAIALYLASLAYRAWLFWSSLERPRVVRISDDEARAFPMRSLPAYTVLIAAYHEDVVVADLIAALEALDYPRDRLEVKLLVEADDYATIEAAFRADPPSHFHVVLVPRAAPRTKPKALNYGLALAWGELVTVYDAEDRPDPLQLRRAAAAFARLPAEVGSLQAQLSYYNSDQNLITRCFTAEYALWFGRLLPGLVAAGAPVPLGGTSTHFRRRMLKRVGAWDSFNVTEDADLGVRLHRDGYRTYVLDSTTLEEANSDFVNWVKQRSRWYKGYLQTWLVHMRDPLRLWREIGARGVISLLLFVGGTPLLALLNPVFWALTCLWFLTRFQIIATLFPPWLYYAGVVCLVVGNLFVMYATIVGARASGDPRLVFVALLSPLYWAMMSIAAIKAFVQLLTAPSLWEKTVHGLTDVRSAPRAGALRSDP